MIDTDTRDALRALRERLYLSYSITEGDIEERIAWAKVELIDDLIGALS